MADMLRRRSRAAMGVVSVVLLAGLFGCGGEGDGGEQLPTDFGPPSNGLFTYEEGKGGTAPGLKARAVVNGHEVESDEVEVVLRGDSAVVQQALLSEEMAGPDLRPIGELDLGGELYALHSMEALASQDPAELGRFFEERFLRTQEAVEALRRANETGELPGDEGPMDPGLQAQREVQQALTDPCPGYFPKDNLFVREIGTFGGWTAMLDWTGSVGGAITADYTWASHLAPEGNYFSLQQGETISVPPDLASASYSLNYTMIKTLDGGPLKVDYLNDLTSVGLSVELGLLGVTINYSYDVIIHPAHGPVGVGIGYGAGWSFNFFGLMNIPISYNLSSGDVVSRGEPGYLLYTGSNEPCSVDVAAVQQGMVQQGLNSNPLAQISNTLQGQASSTPKGRRNALSNSGSAAISPLFQALSQPTGHGPAKHVAAATNADLYADYLSRGDDCSDGCPDTSLSYINTRAHILSQRADSDGEKLALGYSMMNKVMESVPQINMQWALQGPIQTTVGMVEEGVLGGNHDGEKVFVSEDVIYIPAPLNEEVEFSITAEEIAELVGVSPQEVEGAEVCLNFLMDINDPAPACGTMGLEGLTPRYTLYKNEYSTIMVSVDLSTAAGFTPEEVEDWNVKLAMRVFTPAAADKPASIALTAPKSIVSGGPASLSAMLVDEHGVPFNGSGEVEFLDYKDRVIGKAALKDGVATYQFVPSPVKAEIEVFEETVFDSASGDTTYEGYRLGGEGISRHSEIRVNGKTVADYGGDEVPSGHLNWYIQSFGQVGFALIPNDEESRLKPGSHTVELIGPTGESTGKFNFTID